MNIIDINQKNLDSLKPQEYESIYDHAKMRERYIEYAKNLQKSKVYLGLPNLDKKMGGLRPGELMTIVGPTNTGKSALSMGFMYEAALQDEGLIFCFSTENSCYDIYERFLLRHLNWSVEDIEKLYSTNPIHDSAAQKIIELVNNVYAVIKKVKPDDIMKYVQYISQLSGKSPRLIIVDHLQGLKLPQINNKADSLDMTMQYLKECALHSGLPIILTAHVSREEAKGKVLSLYSGKGSGEIENSSQIFFTLENLRELPEDVKPNFHISVLQDWHNQEIEILRFTAHKTKRGKYKENWLMLNNRNLKIDEILLTT